MRHLIDLLECRHQRHKLKTLETISAIAEIGVHVSIYRIARMLKQPLCAWSAAACLLFGASASAETGDEPGVHLSLGLYTSNKPSTMVRILRPIVTHIEQQMTARLGQSVKIRMQIAKNYQQGIEHLTAGKVDFSRFGPASYVEAKKSNPDLKILALESINNSKVFFGIIATHIDNPMTDVTELRGKSFGFGDQQSAIGRYQVQQYLAEHGIGAPDLGHYEYLGRNDVVGTKVGSGEFTAGALSEWTFRRLLSQGEQIREMARFPTVSNPWIARSGLDVELFDALQQCLLELTDKESLHRLKIDGFLEGTDLDYDVIRTAIEGNDSFFSMSADTQTRLEAEPVEADREVVEVPAAAVVKTPDTKE